MIYTVYILLRYFNVGMRGLRKIDMSFAGEMLRMHRDDQMRADVFAMQMQGIDPMKVPYYAGWLGSMESKRRHEKARLTDEEAAMYKNVFDGVLKRAKRG